MSPNGTLPLPAAEGTVACGLAAYGTVHADPERIAQWRLTLSRPGADPWQPSFLKHSDDQTVAGLAAVLQAIGRHGLAEENFDGWGVLAAPRFLGRATLAAALHRFELEGAWGVSPHLIPHRSLHSLSGTVSQALGIHGPNFGVGGGPDSATEAMLAAGALIGEGRVPGLWVIMTALDPEPVLEKVTIPNAQKMPLVNCLGVALALVPLASTWRGPRLAIGGGVARPVNGHAGASAMPARLEVRRFLNDLQAARPAGIWRIAGDAWVELKGAPASAGGSR